MKIVWTDLGGFPRFGKLKGDLKTDVLIIGGGMAGILCAYKLKQKGVDYALIEKDRILGGVTGCTTAKITAQHGLIYDKLIKEIGIERAKQYYKVNMAAVEEFQTLCQGIECDFEIKDSYVYSLSDKSKIENELRALQCMGVSAKYARELGLPITVAGAVKFEKQAQFNPIKFAAAIAKDLNIYEQTKAKEFDGHNVITDCGKIKAKKIIVATHFPFLNKHGAFFLKMYQHRSYVLGLEGAGKINGMYVDENKCGLSFRSYNDVLLLGGGSHRTGKKGGGYAELAAFTKAHYPKSQIRYYWATQDCMTLDSIPYIGQYSKMTPDLFVATGFNKWGMTSSMVSANVLCDLVLEKENIYSHLFSPSRSILHPQLICNIFESATNLLTLSTPRCPHLGCALKWNSQEHSWDCPCHGSRFSQDGKLLDNPSTGDLKL